jgi:hypothetical protein
MTGHRKRRLASGMECTDSGSLLPIWPRVGAEVTALRAAQARAK